MAAVRNVGMRHAKRILQKRSFVRPGQRCASTENFNYVRLLQNDKLPGVTTLEMCRKPVNSLNSEFVKELTHALDMLESDKYNKGLIITSAVPGIFSAGLDIVSELYQPNRDNLVAFWNSVQNLFVKLYVSPLVTMAAINGACVAGGCVFSLAFDQRIIADDSRYKIGLNEVQLGFPVPNWAIQWLTLNVGHRQAEKAAQLGKLFSPADAKSIGLVDHAVPVEKLEDYTIYTMGRCLKVPWKARQHIKEDMRRPLAEKILSKQAEDTDAMVSLITSDAIQQTIGEYMENLKKGKK